MNKFDQRAGRERLSGYRALLSALEPGGGFTLEGKIMNEEQAEHLRREIAYLERVLPPKEVPAES